MRSRSSLVLTDRGTEYCGNLEHHEYELYLAIEDIDHTRTKARSPQTNGICGALFIRPCSMSSIASPSESGSTRRIEQCCRSTLMPG